MPIPENATQPEAVEPPPRFTEAAIEVAKNGISAEPKVVDFVLDPSREVELTVAAWDDGSRRHGYAGYYCLKLREWGVYDERMDVRIVDAARLAASNGDWRSISLGGIRCADESYFD